MADLRRKANSRAGRSQEGKEIRQEIKELRKEVRTREENLVKSILRSRDVVLSTCVGASHGLLRNMIAKSELSFDLCIIDEAAQALEASCWIPMLYTNKVVLAGGSLPVASHNQEPRSQ